jgi:hypothetical protein
LLTIRDGKNVMTEIKPYHRKAAKDAKKYFSKSSRTLRLRVKKVSGDIR